GRGTSTYDGLSLAWSILEHIHTRVRAKTLFATHFHELTALESEYPNLKNATVLVQKNGQDIVFLHQLAFGASNKSFGIEVARLAGLPVPVLSRAREILENFDRSKVLERSSQKSIQNYEKKSLESRSLIES
ncbi:DNA mismatch repair protein MutS, partial [bacterium]|nr:DNA mismatch repair protein MutS [bacterium]